jgi:2-succinyl-5-enolpyruvyl-6-hydroxy-3-cyclohexene-1-carboxylate synthase
VVTGWLAASGAAQIVATDERGWVDPSGTAAVILAVSPEALLEGWAADLARVEAVDGGAWAARWHDLGRCAQAAIDDVLDREPAATEPLVARRLVAALPPTARLVASSSMPIRDLEWYVRPSGPLEVAANRGANGIDGVVSTAVGLALADRDRPTALLVGDLAFLHDSNGLLGASSRRVDLVVVVVDNDGGGIFSFLPPAAAVAPDRFEQLFGTPHGLDLVALAAAYGAQAAAVDDVEGAVRGALAAGGVHVLVARTDRAANVDVHRRLNAAVAAAVATAP